MPYILNILVFCAFLFAMFPVTDSVEETVDTTSGVVMGIRVLESKVIKYLGIPYAEPPIGERRFMPPVKKTRMSMTFDATSDGFACPQEIPSLGEALFGGVRLSEDCLNLNVFVPQKATKIAPLSVMVWVFGGSYVTGAANFYDSTLLADFSDVIVVVVNYRLGVLGFLNTMDDNAVGNFGLRDQCLALQWIKDNIAEFGGNASSITLFGNSAGGSSVTQLTMASICQGLFHRVISQSGSPLASWASNPNPLESAKELGRRIRCPVDTTSLLVQCLRSKSVDEILLDQTNSFDVNGNVRWAPSYTPDFFSFVPKELPLWKDIPVENKMGEFDLMTGLNKAEGEFFYNYIMRPKRGVKKIDDKTDGLPDSTVIEILTHMARGLIPGSTSQADKLLASLQFEYSNWENPDWKFSNSKTLIDAIGDVMFHVSSVQYARLHSEMAQKGEQSDRGRTYFYRFNPRASWMNTDPWTTGACHADDIFFLFGSLFSGKINGTAEEEHLSRTMMEYWTNFAKTGDPNQPSKRYIVTKWPSYNLGAEEYIELDVNMTCTSIGKRPYARRVEFWEEFIPEQIKLTQHSQCDKQLASGAGITYSRNLLAFIIFVCFFSSK